MSLIRGKWENGRAITIKTTIKYYLDTQTGATSEEEPPDFKGAVVFFLQKRNFYKIESNQSDMFTTQLDLSNVSSGIYLLNVNSGTKAATKKIIIK